MGETEELEGRVKDTLKYLLERVRALEAENKELRASEGRYRQYLEGALEGYEDSEREAQAIRDILYPAEELADGTK